MTSDLSIEMLPAGHGDALWLEWGPAPERRRMLIDGGTRGTFTTLDSRFEQLGDHPRVELMVVTHIDADHIDGAIKLLGNRDLGVKYGDVWFNGWPHLRPPDSPPTRGGRQGSVLEAVLEERGRPWNEAFQGGAVVVESSGPLPAVRLAGGMRLTLLSPTWQKLEELLPEWKRALDEAEMDPDDRSEALEYAESRYGVTRGRTDFGADHSEANGSSIAFVAEYADERWLFAGDAHVDVLLSGLQRFAAERDEDRLRLDGFKVPHHGSVKNIRADLLDAIDCRRFLVSTNGAYFKHPDKACIDLIVGHSHRPELVFNYETDFNRDWAADGDEYTSRYTQTVQRGIPGEAASDDERLNVAGATSRDERVDDVDEGLESASSEDDGGRDRSSDDLDGPSIAVTVHHGSLDRADHPVLVGHYMATALAGAAGSADRRLEGRIAGRLAAGAFVGAWSTSARVVAPETSIMAQGAIVVGLGEYSRLTRMRLTETVRRALLDHALAEADRSVEDWPLELEISSVLLGATGDQGLSVRATVQAIVAAVLAVNRDLRRVDEADRPDEEENVRAQYRALQFFERGPAEAELAYLAVCELAEGTQSEQPLVTPPDGLRLAEGRLVNDLPYDASQGVWWRMRVDDISPKSEGGELSELRLEYSVSGGLARAGRVVHLVERRRLTRRLRQHAGEFRPPDALHTVLYELLLPNSIKADLMAAQDIQLEVTAATADIPWEMLAARDPAGSRSPLALRAPFVRQLRLAEVREIERADGANALVIGNPPGGAGFDSLRGAAEEAEQVHDLLRDDYDVVDFVFRPGQGAPADVAVRLEEAVINGGYRIMHIAGHGVFQPDEGGRTGIVIGSDQFLSADVFLAMRYVPDLVFLNCCHLAHVGLGQNTAIGDYTKQRLPQLAASLSTALIDSGVRAVVAAGWAVEDSAAKRFAAVFYEKMLAAVPFGDAVFEARKAADQIARETPSSTWGAYQCYGDAGYRLPPGRSDRSGGRRRERAAAPGRAPKPPRTVYEAYRELEKTADRAETASPAELADLRAEFEQHIRIIEDHARGNRWFDEQGGRLWEILAATWQAIGALEQAIDCYEHGLLTEKATMSLAGVEQLANLCDRRAAALLDEPVFQAEAEALVARSATLLDQLGSLHPSGERLALSAGNLKRRAGLVDEQERLPTLEASADGYLRSYRENPQPYTLFNFLQVAKLCALHGAPPDDYESLVTGLSEAVERVETKPVSTRSFWDLVALPDARLTQALVDGTVAVQRDELEQLYRRALSRGRTSQRDSTIDHLRDLARLHPDPDESAALAQLHRRLREELLR